MPSTAAAEPPVSNPIPNVPGLQPTSSNVGAVQGSVEADVRVEVARDLGWEIHERREGRDVDAARGDAHVAEGLESNAAGDRE